MVASLDAFVRSLGDPGRFQIVAFLLLWSNTFPLAFNNFIMVYYGLPPKHHCKLPDNSSWPLNESLPLNTKKIPHVLDSCSMFVDPSNHSLGTQPCNEGWVYTTNPDNSIVGEWDLICNEKWKVSLATSIYFVGVMFGGLLGGLISDKFGRYPVILTSIYAQAVFGLAVIFSPNYICFVVIRFIQALFLQTLQTNSFTLIMELFQPRMRTVVGTICSLAWTSAVVVLAAVASQIQSWHHLQLFITLPSIFSFFYFWFIPESMRWLVSKQKVDRAEKLAKKIMKFNGLDGTSDVRNQIEKISLECSSGNDTGRKSSLLDLVRTPIIRRFTLVLGFLWFTASLITYGVSYALPSLGGNIYASFAISGSLDFVIRLLVIPALDRFGRKRPTIACYMTSGICCLLVPIIQKIGQGSAVAEIISMIAAVFGKAFMSACFAIIPIYTTELYPTIIRSLGQGMAAFLSRIGGIMAPQLTYVGEIAWKPFPFVVCGISGIIASLLTLWLPETHKMPMPDMIEDVEGVKLKADKIPADEKKPGSPLKPVGDQLEMDVGFMEEGRVGEPMLNAEPPVKGLANGGFEVDRGVIQSIDAEEEIPLTTENEKKAPEATIEDDIILTEPDSDVTDQVSPSDKMESDVKESDVKESDEPQVSRL